MLGVGSVGLAEKMLITGPNYACTHINFKLPDMVKAWYDLISSSTFLGVI